MQKAFRLYKLLTICLLVVSIVYAPGTLQAQGKQISSPSFSLAVSPESAAVKIGGPVWVVVKLESQSDHAIPIYVANSTDSDQGGWVYRVEVKDDNGKAASETTFYRHLRGHLTAEEKEQGGVVVMRSGGTVPLKPGETRTDRVNLARLCDFSHPGKYTVQVQRYDVESRTIVKSNTATLILTP